MIHRELSLSNNEKGAKRKGTQAPSVSLRKMGRPTRVTPQEEPKKSTTTKGTYLTPYRTTIVVVVVPDPRRSVFPFLPLWFGPDAAAVCAATTLYILAIIIMWETMSSSSDFLTHNFSIDCIFLIVVIVIVAVVLVVVQNVFGDTLNRLPIHHRVAHY